MAVYPQSTMVSGIVSAVNPKGIKLSPQDEWFNLSKYGTDEIVLPARGTSVTVSLDRGGFIRAISPADGSVVTNGAPRAHGASTGQKDRTITRLAVLKAAAEYVASKPESKSADVLKIAASWERWVLRDDDPSELVDAF